MSSNSGRGPVSSMINYRTVSIELATSPSVSVISTEAHLWQLTNGTEEKVKFLEGSEFGHRERKFRRLAAGLAN